MKRTEKILGFPVIDISTGERLGRVKDFIFNGDNGTVDYLVVENDAGGLMARVVSTADILGIGEYAVTIGSEASVKELNSTVDAVRLLKKDIKIRNTGILTKKGTVIGQTGDVYIDEDDNCRIVGLEFITKEGSNAAGGRRILPASSVITYGRNLIIVEVDAENKLVSEAAMLSGEGSPKSDHSQLNNMFGREAAESYVAPDREPEPAGIVNFDDEEAGNGANENSMPKESAADLFEQRQRQYLVGRRATRTIADKDGNVLVEEGMIINNEIIDQAKKSGKLVELIMNNRE